MKRLSILLFLIIYIPGLSAQVASVVPTSSSIANTSAAVLNDWNAFQNVPALGNIKRTEVSAQYENRFMIKELNTRSLQAGFNAQYVNVGLSFSYMGYSTYNEMIAGLGIARNFSDKFSMGVQFDYYTAYFSAAEESRYRGVLLAQFGIASQIFPKLTVGFNAFNPFQTNIKTEYTEKRIPSIFSLGTNYAFADNLIWLSQIDKEVNHDFRFASGFEYTMIKELTIKLGAYETDFLVPCLGFGIHLGDFHFNLNGELHPQLGLNTIANLKYRF